MSHLPPHERPSARELASVGSVPMQIAGKPAAVCPYCGCGMFVYGTRDGEAVTFQYVRCLPPRGCGRKFYSKQPPATLVREIGVNDIASSSGRHNLTLHEEAG